MDTINGNAPPGYTMHANNTTLPPYTISTETPMEPTSHDPPSYSSVVKYTTNSNQPIVQIKTSDENSNDNNNNTNSDNKTL
jgi:hypothetical protein